MDDMAVKCFLAAAEHQGFSAAAEELFLTRQAISRQIKKLETEIGAPLFDRQRGVLTLTPAGDACRDFFLESGAKWQRVKQQLAQLQQEEIVHIRISCVNGIDIWRLLNGSMQQVQKTHNFEVDISYHSPDVLIEALKTGGQDLYITFHPGDAQQVPAQYTFETISPVDMCLVAGKAHPLSAHAHCASDFNGEPMITWLRKNDTEERCIQKCLWNCKNMGFQPGRILVFPNMESAHAAIEFCKGVGLCSTVSKLISSQAVIHFPLQAGADLVCLYDKDSIPPIGRALVEALLQNK